MIQVASCNLGVPMTHRFVAAVLCRGRARAARRARARRRAAGIAFLQLATELVKMLDALKLDAVAAKIEGNQ